MTQTVDPMTAPGVASAAKVSVASGVSFDAALGGDVSALNATIAGAFPVVRPLVFPQKFEAEGVSVAIDMLVPPTVAIKATAAFQAEAEAAVAKSGLTAADAHSAIASLLNGSLTVSCSDVQAVITYTGQPSATVNASLETGAAVSLTKSGTQWSATVGPSHATATVPNEPELTALLTDVAAPLLLDYLNNHVLSAIAVPAIDLLGVQLAVPVITEEQSASGGDDFLIAYTGLTPVVAPASGTAWPAGTLFAAVDAAALQAVAANALPKPIASGTWSGPSGFWGSLGADYSATVSNPSVQVPSPGSGNQVNISFDLSGNTDFTIHTPDDLPNIPFGGSVTGSVSGGAKVSARPDGLTQDIYISIDQIAPHDLDLSVSLAGIPLSLGDVGPLADVIGAAAATVLENFSFKVTTLPVISLRFAPGYVLVPQNVALQSIAGPGGLPMEAVTLGLSIAKQG